MTGMLIELRTFNQSVLNRVCPRLRLSSHGQKFADYGNIKHVESFTYTRWQTIVGIRPIQP